MDKKLIKTIVIMLVAALLFSHVAYAAESEEYPDVIEYNYETGEAHVIKAYEFMNSSRAYSGEEATSPPYNVSSDSSRAIIGSDNRRVVEASEDPYRKVICMNIGQDTDGNGSIETWGLGTGFMVDDDVMLTAAHCFHDKSNGWGAAEEVQLYLMQEGPELWSTYYHPYSWTISSNYLNASGYTSTYDWCVVKLGSALGNQTGWFGYGIPLGSKSIYISGYPDQANLKCNQFYHWGTMELYNSTQFIHTCDTYGGQSGAPAYDSDYYVWGIHTGGHSSTHNKGCIITAYLKALIDSKK